jgi:hypothetical protein
MTAWALGGLRRDSSAIAASDPLSGKRHLSAPPHRANQTFPNYNFRVLSDFKGLQCKKFGNALFPVLLGCDQPFALYARTSPSPRNCRSASAARRRKRAGVAMTFRSPSSIVHIAGLRMVREGANMDDQTIDASELDELQAAYKAAVEKWIAAIGEEEALASVNHNVAEIDQWEAAHFKEDELREVVLEAKKQYEDALRRKFFNF